MYSRHFALVLCSPVLLISASCRVAQPHPVADSAPTTAEAAPATAEAAPPTADAAAGPACTSTDGAGVVNGLLASLTPALNKAWPSVAVSTGLDPYQNALVNQKVSLKCSYGGDEICGLQAAKCKEEYADVTVSTITGLSYMQFKDMAVTSLQAQPGSHSCPFGSSTKGGTYACSFEGNGAGGAFLLDNEVITANLSEIKVKVKCEIPYIKTWTETVFNGSARCTGSEPEGTGTFGVCGGSCASGSVANLSTTALTKLDLKLGSLSCKVSPSYNLVSWVAGALAPAIKTDLLNAIEPPLMRAINDFVAGYLPFPSTCGG